MQRGAGRIRSPGTDSFLFYIPGNGYQYGGPLGEVTASVLIGLREPSYEIIIFVSILSTIIFRGDFVFRLLSASTKKYYSFFDWGWAVFL